MRQCWNRQTGTFEGRVSLTYGFKSRLPHQVRGFAKAKPLSFLPFVSYFVAGFESDFTPNRLKIELCSKYSPALPVNICCIFESEFVPHFAVGLLQALRQVAFSVPHKPA